jgi:hypothetical protein
MRRGDSPTAQTVPRSMSTSVFGGTTGCNVPRSCLPTFESLFHGSSARVGPSPMPPKTVCPGSQRSSRSLLPGAPSGAIVCRLAAGVFAGRAGLSRPDRPSRRSAAAACVGARARRDRKARFKVSAKSADSWARRRTLEQLVGDGSADLDTQPMPTTSPMTGRGGGHRLIAIGLTAALTVFVLVAFALIVAGGERTSLTAAWLGVGSALTGPGRFCNGRSRS